MGAFFFLLQIYHSRKCPVAVAKSILAQLSITLDQRGEKERESLSFSLYKFVDVVVVVVTRSNVKDRPSVTGWD